MTFCETINVGTLGNQLDYSPFHCSIVPLFHFFFYVYTLRSLRALRLTFFPSSPEGTKDTGGNYRPREETIAATPNPRMTRPEMRLIQRNPRGLKRFRKAPIPKLKIHHHRADPRKTPATNIPAAKKVPPAVPNPSPAKITAKAKMVRGLARVRKKVEK